VEVFFSPTTRFGGDLRLELATNNEAVLPSNSYHTAFSPFS